VANFVLALFGTKSQKDKVSERTELRSGAPPTASVPAVTFPDWREGLKHLDLHLPAH
jgi:hypothetical protein